MPEEDAGKVTKGGFLAFWTTLPGILTGVAAVIDPQRDIDRILDLATSRDVRITHVLETHLHNDYVSGGGELAATTGAAYLISADDEVSFDRDPLHGSVDLFGRADVDPHGDGTAAGRGDRRHRLGARGLVEVQDGDGVPVLGQTDGSCGPDAAGCAGDDRGALADGVHCASPRVDELR